jgi:hypothetical protein
MDIVAVEVCLSRPDRMIAERLGVELYRRTSSLDTFQGERS